jgi:hypothetical protein
MRVYVPTLPAQRRQGIARWHRSQPLSQRWTGSLRTIEAEFARAPEDIRRRIPWLPIGTAAELAS